MIELWTDGCCLKNPGGAGGWAWIAVRGGKEIDRGVGGSESTTNNIMEMTAVLRALEAHADRKVVVITDSRYVIGGATTWRHKWAKNGWRRKGRGKGSHPVKNEKLWKDIAAHLDARDDVEFRWVKGHNFSEFNELADMLAGQEAEAHA